MYLLESPRRGDSNKYTKRMIHENNCSKVSVIHALHGSTYNSKFDFTAKSLVTNSVIITRALCIIEFDYLSVLKIVKFF